MPDPILSVLDQVQGRAPRPPGADLLATSRRDSALSTQAPRGADLLATSRRPSPLSKAPGADLLIPSHRPDDPDILAALDTVQAGPSLTERAIPMAMRVGGAIAGGIAGAPAGPAGVMALGAGGAGVGEIAAQDYEIRHGLRADPNVTQALVQTGLGAIPAGRALGSTVPGIIAARGVQGGVMGGGSTVATQLAETGELPTAGQVAMGTGLGAILGGTFGAVEGRAALRARAPQPPPRGPIAALPPGATFRASPDGRVAPAGVDIPMTQAPDGSFVRGVPAAYARHEIAGLLPAGREPIIPPAPPGSVPPDPSFVRGVPAQYARRDIRGLLPPGPRFVAGPDGVIAATGDADPIIAALDRVQGRRAAVPRGPDPSGGRGVPAAVLARDVDVTQPTPKAVTVRQFSGDPSAVDAPLLSAEDVAMLRRMREDMAEFVPQRGRLVTDPNDPNSSIYAGGVRGSYVGEDIRVISRQRVGNPHIVQAIDDLLAGKPPTNKLHLAAIDAARGYGEGRAGYRGPQLPMEAVAPGRVGAVAASEPVSVRTVAPSQERVAKMAESNRGADRLDELQRLSGGSGARASGLRGSIPSPGRRAGQLGEAIDDFDAFSRMFDDIEPGTLGAGREPGEEGFITPMVAARLGGAAAGAATGFATGEDTEDRIGRAVLFGAAGAAAPSLLSRRQPGIIDRPRASVPGIVAAAPGTTARAGGRVVSPPGRMGQPMRDPLAGTDVFVAKFSNPLVRDGIRERLTENAGYAEQRRGVIGTEDLGRFADEVRINVGKILPKGSALNAEQVTAYARGLQETQRKVNELAATVATGTSTDADALALLAARADADVLTKSLMGARAEAGRALGAFRLYSSVLDTGNVTLIRDTLRAPGLRREAERIAAALSELPDDPMTRYNWLRTQKASTLMDKARSIYYANILSGVKTHERNVIGNLANLSAELVVHPVAAGIDATRSRITGAPRTIRFDELTPRVAGALAGVERGFRDALFTARHGVSPDRLTRTVGGATDGSKFDLPRVEFAGGAGNPFNWPGRALDTGDTFFRSVARNMELYGAAHTQAKNEGLTGARFLDRVAELRGGLSAEGQALKAQAETFATRTVFQEQPGRIVSGWQGLVREAPVLSLLTPFVKTPANIMRQGLEFSPAGAVMTSARQGGRAGAQAQARVVLGTTAAGYFFWLAATGRLSGNGPRNPNDRAALMESGWRPNSVRVGDQWVSFQLMQPLSVQMALVGNAVEAWREAGSDPANGADVAAKTFAKSIGSFLDQSFLSGLFDFMEAVNDPERSAARFGGRMASSAIPFTGAVRTVQQAMDPVVRRPRGVQEHAMGGIPGLSEQIAPRIGRFGQVVTREGGPIRRATDPFNVSSVANDPVSRELDRLGVLVSLPSDRLALTGDRALTREQETAVMQRRGQTVRRALEQVMNDQRYNRLDDAGRTRVIKRLLPRVRAQASTGLRRDLSRVPGIIAPASPAR